MFPRLHGWTPTAIERGRVVISRTFNNAADAVASRLAAGSYGSLGCVGPLATHGKHTVIAATPGTSRSGCVDGPTGEPSRRQFGPEPPPQQPVTSSMSSLPAVLTGPQAQPTPKRRGRPPKPKSRAPDTVPSQQPETQSTQFPSAATTAPQAASATNDSTAAASTCRKAFGPEPAPPAGSVATDKDPTMAASSTTPSAALPFLPADPSQLRPDDILNLPLPDARLGEPLRLNVMEDLLGDDAGDAATASGDDVDEDEDMDYERLIALGTRVDAATYIERAFERAKRGLNPTPDPLAAEQPQVAEPAAAAPGPQPRPPPHIAASSSTSTAGGPGTPSAAPSRQGRQGSVQRPDSGGGISAVASSAIETGPSRPLTAGGGVYVDDFLGINDAAQPAPGAAASPEDEEAAVRRRVALLVDLMSASGSELEARLEAAAPDVDEQLLMLLERRYTTALQLGQDDSTKERIAGLYRALRYVYERRISSPAERLLDDVLEILADAALQPDAERRRQDAAARLRNAFTGGMLDVDIFTAAAALAERRQAAVEALAGEQVSLEEFKAETMQLLSHAKKVQAETQQSLQTIDAEVEKLRREEPAVLRGPEWQVRLEQVRLARQALVDREGSIEALEEVVLLTRAIELQLLTGRMAGL